MNESDLDSDSNEIIYDTDSDIEVISDSYFKINSLDVLNKKNIKLKSDLVKLTIINETVNENLLISKKTILEMNQMIYELTNKVNELEHENKEITSKLIIADKKSVGIQVNEFSTLNINSDSDNNWFLSKAVYLFFLLSCSGIMYNYNNLNKPK